MARLDRVSSLLKQEIARILRQRVNDSRIGFISITEIKLSKDLAHAWIYYSQLGNDIEKNKTKKGLYSATKFIEQELYKVDFNLKTLPKLHFKFDPSLERGVELVNKINDLDT